MKKKQNEAGELEFICSEDPRPHIKPGEYETQITKIEIKPYRKQKRVYLHHQITSGEYMGVTLFQSINASYEKYGLGTKYYQQWKVANYNRTPRKGQKMSLETFRKKIFKCKVQDADSETEYSVVSVITDVIAPDCPK